MKKKTVRYTGEVPIVLFHTTIEPNQIRELHPAQLRQAEEMHPGEWRVVDESEEDVPTNAPLPTASSEAVKPSSGNPTLAESEQDSEALEESRHG